MGDNDFESIFKPTGEIYSYEGDFTLNEAKNYIDGVDELAEKLGVEPAVDMTGVMLHGKSQNKYSLTELLTAHIDMMTKTLGDKND